MKSGEHQVLFDSLPRRPIGSQSASHDGEDETTSVLLEEIPRRSIRCPNGDIIALNDVFLSHQVKSMGAEAKQLHRILEERKISAFISTGLQPGAEFHTAISLNINHCEVMVFFLNEEWEKSDNCTREFRNANNLTPRPAFVPIFEATEWIKPGIHPTTHTLLANYTPIIKGASSWEDVLNGVAGKIERTLARKTPILAMKAESIPVHLLKCPVCLRIFRNPKVLSCHHSFCERCIKKWFEGRGKPFVVCPMCDLPVPDKIENLTSDFKMNRLLDFYTV